MSTEPTEGQRPIIRITKKKVIVAGHHGGAWKVAYADFVTAMMAFFLVMWLISMDQQTKEEIQEYFNNPFTASTSKAGIASMSMGGKSPVSIGTGVGLSAKNWRELAMEFQRENMVKAQNKIEGKMAGQPGLGALSKQVEIKVTSYGMMIDLVEAERSPFFASGSAILPAPTIALLKLIAQEVGKLPNSLWIEGHTDAVSFGSGGSYSNWELSADRANAARRVMEGAGLRPQQVAQVRGYAASNLRHPEKPADASNRRVTIVVLFKSLPADEKPTESTPGRGTDNTTQPAIIKGNEAKKEPLELTLERLHGQDMRPWTTDDPKNPLGIKVDARTAMNLN
ncbi:flagellar motor protein MotB [Armatimonas sp.]|uniref:flagellar motor protein MotB n=1 Tax=Armatimonas sp. TaxID=1872638 RepID=UPI00286C1AAD|nr:flagellar motor protein MotB [Armatimonas sp.]